MSKAVVLLSGGVDSTTLLYDVLKQYEVYPISFHYGQRHDREVEAAAETCDRLHLLHKIFGIERFGGLAPSALTEKGEIPHGHYEEETMKLTVVPNRNMVLISLAVAYAIGIGAKDVFYGAHGGDHAIYPDCRDVFVDAMQKAVRLCDWSEVVLHAPYLYFDKADIVKRGIELGVDYSLTWTCYEGRRFACGECSSCVERLEAFEKNGITDPIKYERR